MQLANLHKLGLGAFDNSSDTILQIHIHLSIAQKLDNLRCGLLHIKYRILLQSNRNLDIAGKRSQFDHERASISFKFNCSTFVKARDDGYLCFLMSLISDKLHIPLACMGSLIFTTCGTDGQFIAFLVEGNRGAAELDLIHGLTFAVIFKELKFTVGTNNHHEFQHSRVLAAISKDRG
ncbi:hypothetical protein N7499_006237 [Penicillium canescens]|uniref:Uncharacterized protein n=1 Tax=Penicillium canescens TaxID=5083 RepID=A0AAD6IEF9_PENCN|nr:uncharacterized protein N7446_002016 [Penicillium canescens]KAJ5997369.1 hypothetical protein N7522_009029 [Penicillium canescens]KAJ6043818.1 hypothetical protein N7460_005173 [Penicillium canescens]KAJ6055292.1 hypothetical protein N7444_004390 [Penicillium canescens]KAJ6074239.1 hypothetical protein N7446_002016 [Penicillium canescens]KAJ6081363.1 hypothetical protein N7499_006237 [Penicillium canescens]